MTKKELLENDAFKSLPDDAEIVFATDKNLKYCIRLNELNLSAIRQCVNFKDIQESVLNAVKPKYMTALVIDAIPYWLLKEKYNIHFTDT